MSFKPLTITVLSDVHHYSIKSGTGGKAYDAANAKSQKLLSESGDVLRATFDKIASDKSNDIVLVSGDITNNGELTAHEEIIEMFNDLKAKGKRVYVITATHDFRDNGVTDAYDGDNKITTPTATRAMLYDMYRSFGPDEAIAVHRDSMSYVVQLCEGYRLFALNDDRNLSGKSGFSDECFEWITNQAEDARKNNQVIIAMTHHPLIAPSPIYELIGKGDMLGDYDKRLYQLADIGVQFIFTGHTHIHDISFDQSERKNTIYDICTASPVGYPGAYRKVTFEPDKNFVDVTTEFVPAPDSIKKSGRDIKDVFENQLRMTSKKWEEGMKLLGEEGELSDISYISYSLFRASYNQVKFVRLRDEYLADNNAETAKALVEVIKEEKAVAEKVYEIMCRRPEVGFEAANHYYYSKGMIAEKIINCNWLIEYYS